MALAILDAQNSLLDWDLVTVFIQLPEGDDIILEAREEEDTNELDFFSCLTGERHDVTDLSWNQRPVTEPHDSLQLATELREGLYSPRHVACRTGVHVPTFKFLVGAQEDVGLQLLQLKTALWRRCGVD
jgi:hypothetical protein